MEIISHFNAWQQELTWRAAILLLALIVIGSCAFAAAIRIGVRELLSWRERRAVAERKRRERVQLILDAQREREQREAQEDAVIRRRTAMRVWRDRVQSNREAKQFHISPAFRYFKGVQR